MPGVTQWLWERDTPGAQLARLGLAPASWGVRAIARVRASAYHAGWLTRHSLPLPSVSVGNLTVGGTGKTPVASWIAVSFAARGVTPAILLRGYGGDEGDLHRRNVPSAIVIESPDRLDAANRAMEAGAQVLVLDDAFQRLGVARDLDIVLVSAESLQRSGRTLPAGPWREPGSALGRADLGVITRKRATPGDAARAARWMGSRLRPECPVAVAELALGGFAGLRTSTPHQLAIVRDARVLAVAGIGDPSSFGAQLRGLDAKIDLRAFRDHHRYDAADVRALLAASRHADYVVMTGKDAVKLRQLWPAETPEPLVAALDVRWEVAGEEVERALERLLVRRRTADVRGVSISA